ncbi:MAG: 4a-hydroxytetrahydrobiopterin dehydratase [Bacteroidota bacterium]
MTWIEKDNQLQATYKFDNFTQAWAFMTEVAFAAEAAEHHPNWSNVYNTVEIALTTHDAGNTVTQKDRDLAQKIEEIYERYGK